MNTTLYQIWISFDAYYADISHNITGVSAPRSSHIPFKSIGLMEVVKNDRGHNISARSICIIGPGATQQEISEKFERLKSGLSIQCGDTVVKGSTGGSGEGGSGEGGSGDTESNGNGFLPFGLGLLDSKWLWLGVSAYSAYKYSTTKKDIWLATGAGSAIKLIS